MLQSLEVWTRKCEIWAKRRGDGVTLQGAHLDHDNRVLPCGVRGALSEVQGLESTAMPEVVQLLGQAVRNPYQDQNLGRMEFSTLLRRQSNDCMTLPPHSPNDCMILPPQ